MLRNAAPRDISLIAIFYRWHLSIYQFYDGTYIIVIQNSESHTFLSFLLTWHATQAC